MRKKKKMQSVNFFFGSLQKFRQKKLRKKIKNFTLKKTLNIIFIMHNEIIELKPPGS